jgi:hypothetical protein
MANYCRAGIKSLRGTIRYIRKQEIRGLNILELIKYVADMQNSKI